MGWADLAAALARSPDLAGAACAGRSSLFDLQPGWSPEREKRERQALALCAECPALAGCRAWFAGLRAGEKPQGVIAGELRRPKRRKRQRQAPVGVRAAVAPLPGAVRTVSRNGVSVPSRHDRGLPGRVRELRARGWSTVEIARELGCSSSTVYHWSKC
ncbi:helix-turn-helix domain-containing protein [Mycobacterium sp. E1715]|uniref:helix-turn-helix domain-containing protein n=1 Tax=Mycobacterium sp. E1715 TaxID=1856863 RepID=UPI0018D42ED0|nr:helix-turn-helix domain-containing protein [Mycobacterium sp. E1715]